jgi:hypothetical protein
VSKYWHVINIGIQNNLTYRFNFLARSLFGLIPLTAVIYLWRTIYAGKSPGAVISSYNLAEMISYYLLVHGGERVHDFDRIGSQCEMDIARKLSEPIVARGWHARHLHQLQPRPRRKAQEVRLELRFWVLVLRPNMCAEVGFIEYPQALQIVCPDRHMLNLHRLFRMCKQIPPIANGDQLLVTCKLYRERLPTLAPVKEYVEAGMLMSLGASLSAHRRRSAYYVDKLLKGALIACLGATDDTAFLHAHPPQGETIALEPGLTLAILCDPG